MKRLTSLLIMIVLSFAVTHVAFTQDDKDKDKYDPERARETIAEFKKEDPDIAKFFNSSYGYAVFPSIGKGAIGIGGAAGKGVVFKKGTAVGGSKMSQITIGFQFGGQEYSEVIFFEKKDGYDRFISNKYEFAAQVSAVALKSGASADAKYTEGVIVFTIEQGGLMYEASIGGQKFKFIPF